MAALAFSFRGTWLHSRETCVEGGQYARMTLIDLVPRVESSLILVHNLRLLRVVALCGRRAEGEGTRRGWRRRVVLLAKLVGLRRIGGFDEVVDFSDGE